MTWDNFRGRSSTTGRTYGTKEVEFERVEDLPSRTLGVDSKSPSAGHSPRASGGDPWAGRSSTQQPSPTRRTTTAPTSSGSRGEFSVAKNVYVATRSGWFSCRSVCYLAAGRPVVVQDTGFSELDPDRPRPIGFSTSKRR